MLLSFASTYRMARTKAWESIEMSRNYATSYKEAAKMLGITQVMLKHLIKKLQIQPWHYPHNVGGRGPALTSPSMDRLAEAVEKFRSKYPKPVESPEMSAESLTSYRQAAIQLDTDERTISGLVRAHGLKTEPHPSNGKARGLDAYAMARLAIALGRKNRQDRARAKKSALSA